MVGKFQDNGSPPLLVLSRANQISTQPSCFHLHNHDHTIFKASTPVECQSSHPSTLIRAISYRLKFDLQAHHGVWNKLLAVVKGYEVLEVWNDAFFGPHPAEVFVQGLSTFRTELFPLDV